MKVLGLDCATRGCSAAVCVDGTIVGQRFDAMTRGQAEHLMSMVEGALGDAGLRVAALDHLAVTIGPGAFTGLRVAIATARGLSLASGVPVGGVTTMETLAFAARADIDDRSSTIVSLESRRQDVYLQMFTRSGEPADEVEAVTPDGLTAWFLSHDIGPAPVLVGDAAARVRSGLGNAISQLRIAAGPIIPDAADVAALAREKLLAGRALSDLVPLYLRPPDAALPQHGGRLRP